MDTNKFEKKLLDIEEAKKEKETQDVDELDRLFKNCIHGERSVDERVELEEFIAIHPELILKIKEKLVESITDAKKTKDKELFDFLNTIKDDVFPIPDPNSPEGLRRVAQGQGFGIHGKKEKLEYVKNNKDITPAQFVINTIIESNEKIDNRRKVTEQLVNNVITESNEKAENMRKVTNLLSDFNDEKSLRKALIELVESLKIYPELNDGYIKIVSDLLTKASDKNASSYETIVLKEIKKFLIDENL